MYFAEEMSSKGISSNRTQVVRCTYKTSILSTANTLKLSKASVTSYLPYRKEEFVDPVTGETKKRQVKYYPDAYKNRIGRSYTEYEQYRQLNLFEDFGNYNKEQQPEHENSIGNNTEGTEAPMGATVPDYRIENQPH